MPSPINPLMPQAAVTNHHDTPALKRVRDDNHWSSSSIVPAEDPYDLDLTVFSKKPSDRADGPNSNSCTCNNTCENCYNTDRGCHGTQNDCYVTQNRCGHTDAC